MKLDRQVAVIVGAAHGIGRAIALAFAREGATLALVTGRSSLDEISQQVSDLGRRCIALHCDVTDEAQVNNMVAETVRQLGGLDILVNSAGYRGQTVPVQEIELQEWEKVLAVNLTAAFLCSKAALKVMLERRHGNIISLSGTAGKEALPNRGALVAAKWGLHGLTQSLAVEGGPFGVRANLICPGGVYDDHLQKTMEIMAAREGISAKQMEQRFLDRTPLKKWATLDEVAKAAVFLASDDSSNTTGEALNLSGGQIMH